MRDLTWSCMVCGDDRPDAKIDVHSKVKDRSGFEMRVNIRHCNDRPDCIAGARQHPLLDTLRS